MIRPLMLACIVASTVSSPVSGLAAGPGTRSTLLGTSTFPYAASQDAEEQTFRIAADLSDLFVVQLDDGVPWAEALSDDALPPVVLRKWQWLKAHAPAGRPVYLALEPLAEDRVSMAPATAGSSIPRALRNASFDDESVIRAYLTYTRRAVRFFDPAFLNLGVESGELAHRRPAGWAGYQTLITRVMHDLKTEFPALRIGISFGLQSLMEPGTAERAAGVIQMSDYVGLSFYPNMSSFQEKFNMAALPAPPEQWRKPLDWIRAHTDKPIAICETGYNTADVERPRWNVSMPGTTALQADYVADLLRYAARDHYLFVVYYLPIDIGPILDTLPEAQREEGGMWRDNGLLTSDLRPKPALAIWRRALASRYEAPAWEETAMQAAAALPAAAPTADTAQWADPGFAEERDLCQAPEPAAVRIVGAGDGGKAMLWEYDQRPGDWSWCARPFARASFPAGVGLRFRIRSDTDGFLMLEFKQADGGAYYAVVPVSRDWHDTSIKWTDFKAENSSGGNGHPDPAQITSMIWADQGTQSRSVPGKRQVWVSDWVLR